MTLKVSFQKTGTFLHLHFGTLMGRISPKFQLPINSPDSIAPFTSLRQS